MGKIICKKRRKEKRNYGKMHLISYQTQPKCVITRRQAVLPLSLKLLFSNSVLAQSRCGKFPLNSAKVFALALRFKWFQAKPNFPRKFI